MPPKWQKQAKANENPSGAKTPSIAAQPTLYDDRKVSWRVGRVQLVDPYGLQVLDTLGIVELKEKLASLEKNTFKELFVRDARHNHRIPVNELKCPIAKEWMRGNMPDQPYLWTLRITGIKRVWGIVSEGAYMLVFWDPRHLIWEIPKN